jgi:hypothetical protein
MLFMSNPGQIYDVRLGPAGVVVGGFRSLFAVLGGFRSFVGKVMMRHIDRSEGEEKKRKGKKRAEELMRKLTSVLARSILLRGPHLPQARTTRPRH